MPGSSDVIIHPTAEVSDLAEIGPGSRIWHQAQVRERARLGRQCIVGKGAYIDFDVHIGDRCKLQNGVYVFHGFSLGDGVFLGPGVMLLNDKNPRAVTPEGELKTDSDWVASEGRVERGAAVGGGAVVLPGVRIGAWALVGSGAVVTRDVAAHAIVIGNPARQAGWACECGNRLHAQASRTWTCQACGRSHTLEGWPVA